MNENTEIKSFKEILSKAHEELEKRVEERTAELLKANELLKQEIAVRKQAEEEREKLIVELQDALSKIETLSGLIPICAWCKKVRNNEGYWNEVEAYVEQHSNAHFTHWICPDCKEQYFETELKKRRESTAFLKP